MAPPSSIRRTRPHLGHGVGLRVPHYERALQGSLEVDWVEVISENFFGGGRPAAVLDAVRRERPIVLHGVGMGIASPQAPKESYLAALDRLIGRWEPAWISDHLCWNHIDGVHTHDLLPIPYTRETLGLLVERIDRVQSRLRRPLVLENVSSYVRYAQDEMTEWEFLRNLTRRSGCKLLLDLNNVIVSSHNHGFDPQEFIDAVPAEAVWQFHLANHSKREGHRFDDHRGPVPLEVWELFEYATRRMGRVSTCIEWDEALPDWDTLVGQRDEAARRADAAMDAETRTTRETALDPVTENEGDGASDLGLEIWPSEGPHGSPA